MADRPTTGAASESSTARQAAASSACGASAHPSTLRLAATILCHAPLSIDHATAPAPPTPLVFRAAPPPSKRLYVRDSWRSVGTLSE
eukprot:3458668-Alexandrium_andersonii.AAC.1